MKTPGLSRCQKSLTSAQPIPMFNAWTTKTKGSIKPARTYQKQRRNQKSRKRQRPRNRR